MSGTSYNNHYMNPMGSTRTQENPSWPQAATTLNVGPERTGDSRAYNPKPIYAMPSGAVAATVGNVHKGELVFMRVEERLLSRSLTPMPTKTLPGASSTLNGLGDTSDESKSISEQLRDLEHNMTVLGICPREFDLIAQGNHGFTVQMSGTATVTNNSTHDWNMFTRLGWDFPDPTSDNLLEESSGRQDDNLGRRTLVLKPLEEIFKLYRLSDSLLSIELHSKDGINMINGQPGKTKTKFISPATQDYQRCVTGFTDGVISSFATILSISLHFPEVRNIMGTIISANDMSTRSNSITELVELLSDPKRRPNGQSLVSVYNNVFRDPAKPKVSTPPAELSFRQLLVLALSRGDAFERSLCPLNEDVRIEFGKMLSVRRIFSKTLLDGSAAYIESNMRIHQALIDRRKVGITLEPTLSHGDAEILLTGSAM